MDCWDVGGKADGAQWLKRFPRAGLPQTWREQLQADFAAGLPFDLEAKRFVAPQVPAGPVMPTVFDLTEAYYRQHPEWAPKTKMAAARSFNRARRLLLAPVPSLPAKLSKRWTTISTTPVSYPSTWPTN